MINYRNMTIADYDAVTALWQQTEGVRLRDSDSRSSLGAYIARNPGTSFVAEIDSEIVGAVLCGHDGRRGYLYHLAVAKTHRKQHIGKKLVELALTAIERQGIFKVMIAVNADNFSGADFWKHTGWKPRPDLLFMEKTADGKPNA